MHKKLLATFLSSSMLCVFVACVSLCDRESSHKFTQRVVSYSVDIESVKDVPDCDGCPFNSFPKATSPEKVKLIINLEALQSGLPPTMPPGFCSNPDIMSDRPHGQLRSGSPPLELSAVLRI